MSIEAMKLALEALEWVVDQGGGPTCEHEAGVCFCKENDAINTLRTAIQQAESEPVGEPRARVELMKTGGNAGLSTRIIELDIATRERLRPGDLLYTHPAPGVPDAAIDSAIYNQCPDFDDWHEGPSIDDIRAIVRAAMLAAK